MSNDLDFQLSILRPRKGDLLVLTVPANTSSEDIVRFSEMITKGVHALPYPLDGVITAVILREGEMLECLSDDRLRQLGLQRIDHA